MVRLLGFGTRLDIREIRKTAGPENEMRTETCLAEGTGLNPRTAPRRPHTKHKLTMPIPATFKNVASPHCSDEREMNLQEMERSSGDVAKF